MMNVSLCLIFDFPICDCAEVIGDGERFKNLDH